MDNPLIRPGLVEAGDHAVRVAAFFANSAQGNLAIQVLIGLGIRSDRLGVIPPDAIEGGQGMVVTIACPDTLRGKVEATCRDLGGEVHRAPVGPAGGAATPNPS